MNESEFRCIVCEQTIDGDVMIPEDDGPMHIDCFLEWVSDG